MEAIHTYNPDYAIHPSEYLEEVLESRDISSRELADKMAVSESFLSKLRNGNKPIGPGISLKLEHVLGISSSIWMNLSSTYRLFEARKKEEEEFARQTDWAKEFPLSWMKKHGILPDTRKTQDLIKPLLDFFEVASPEGFDKHFGQQAVSYRKSEAFTANLKASATWLHYAITKANDIEMRAYDKNRFKENLLVIRNLTAEVPERFEPEMKRLCREAGVALLFVPETPKLRVYAVTKWLTPTKAMIVLSLRRKSNDEFWFSFFHEAGHILLHEHSTFIDDRDSKSKKEDEANKFARDMLVDENEYLRFSSRRSFTKDDILAFSEEQNVAPGIIVGFLQHDKKVGWNRFQDLKVRFEFAERK